MTYDICLSIDEAVERAGVSRTTLYQALNPQKAARLGIPHLASIKLGRRRLIRETALSAWLAELEQRSGAQGGR